MTRHYEEPRPISREQYERIRAEGTEEDGHSALVGLTFHDPSLAYVRDECLRLLHAESRQTRSLAATCLGHLARIHGHLDSGAVLPALHALTEDPHTRGAAEDALDDISMFTPETPPSKGG